MGLVGLAVVYLVYLSMRNWIWHYALIATFALGSMAFMYSVDYVFDEILEPHQQIRIKVSLGLEDDPSGCRLQREPVEDRYRVGRTDRERFPERDANKTEICTGTGDGLYILYRRRGARFYRILCGADLIRDIYHPAGYSFRAAEYGFCPGVWL